MNEASDLNRPVVRCENVHFRWPGKHGFRVDIVRFTLAHGERLLLLGPSGSGKSTLLSLVTGIVLPQKGEINIDGTRLDSLTGSARDRFRAEHFGIIFQMFNLLPYGTAIDNVMLPLQFAPERSNRAAQNGGTRHEAHRLLTALGIDETHHNKPAARLSIGQQQRVAGARALIGAPQIIIADEPTSALDRDRQQDFLQLLFTQAGESGTSVLMVSHDDSHQEWFDRVIHLPQLMKTGENA